MPNTNSPQTDPTKDLLSIANTSGDYLWNHAITTLADFPENFIVKEIFNDKNLTKTATKHLLDNGYLLEAFAYVKYRVISKTVKIGIANAFTLHEHAQKHGWSEKAVERTMTDWALYEALAYLPSIGSGVGPAYALSSISQNFQHLLDFAITEIENRKPKVFDNILYEYAFGIGLNKLKQKRDEFWLASLPSRGLDYAKEEWLYKIIDHLQEPTMTFEQRAKLPTTSSISNSNNLFSSTLNQKLPNNIYNLPIALPTTPNSLNLHKNLPTLTNVLNLIEEKALRQRQFANYIQTLENETFKRIQESRTRPLYYHSQPTSFPSNTEEPKIEVNLSKNNNITIETNGDNLKVGIPLILVLKVAQLAGKGIVASAKYIGTNIKDTFFPDEESALRNIDNKLYHLSKINRTNKNQTIWLNQYNDLIKTIAELMPIFRQNYQKNLNLVQALSYELKLAYSENTLINPEFYNNGNYHKSPVNNNRINKWREGANQLFFQLENFIKEKNIQQAKIIFSNLVNNFSRVDISRKRICKMQIYLLEGNIFKAHEHYKKFRQYVHTYRFPETSELSRFKNELLDLLLEELKVPELKDHAQNEIINLIEQLKNYDPLISLEWRKEWRNALDKLIDPKSKSPDEIKNNHDYQQILTLQETILNLAYANKTVEFQNYLYYLQMQKTDALIISAYENKPSIPLNDEAYRIIYSAYIKNQQLESALAVSKKIKSPSLQKYLTAKVLSLQDKTTEASLILNDLATILMHKLSANAIATEEKNLLENAYLELIYLSATSNEINKYVNGCLMVNPDNEYAKILHIIYNLKSTGIRNLIIAKVRLIEILNKTQNIEIMELTKQSIAYLGQLEIYIHHVAKTNNLNKTGFRVYNSTTEYILLWQRKNSNVTKSSIKWPPSQLQKNFFWKKEDISIKTDTPLLWKRNNTNVHEHQLKWIFNSSMNKANWKKKKLIESEHNFWATLKPNNTQDSFPAWRNLTHDSLIQNLVINPINYIKS